MLSSFVFLLLAAPPAIKIERNQTVVIHNGVTIILLPDGSITLKGPSVDLSFPAADGEEVEPVRPDPVVVSPFQKFYDADTSSALQKKLAVKSLIQIWETALKDLPEAKMTGAYYDNLKVMSKPLGNTLIEMRKEISKDLVKIANDDVQITSDISTQLKVTIQTVLVNLKGIK